MRLFIMGLCAVTLFLGSTCSVGAAGKCENVMNKFKANGFSGLDTKESITMMECKFAEWNAKRDKSEAEAAEEKNQGRKRVYEKNPVWLLLDDLKFKSDVGYTNTVGIIRDKEKSDPAPLRLDEEAYSVEVGYFDKPAFDVLL